MVIRYWSSKPSSIRISFAGWSGGSSAGKNSLRPTVGGRHRRDYCLKHDKPKRLFVRELCRNGRHSLQAARLKPALAIVEAKVPARCTLPAKEIRAMVQGFKELTEYPARIESHRLWSLARIILMAVLCGARRGQKDLEKFGRGFSEGERRALGIGTNGQGQYPVPDQSTFCRFFQRIDGQKLEQIILATQEQVRGTPPTEDLIVLDGKEPTQGGGQILLSAVTRLVTLPRALSDLSPLPDSSTSTQLSCLLASSGDLHEFVLRNCSPVVGPQQPRARRSRQ